MLGKGAPMWRKELGNRGTWLHRQSYPRRCKISSVGQSAGLLIPRSSVRFQQKLKKIQYLNLHGFELHRPSSKGTKLLFQVTKAIINQYRALQDVRCASNQVSNKAGFIVGLDEHDRYVEDSKRTNRYRSLIRTLNYA